MSKPTGKIGIFDSGLGGLIILKSIRKLLPQYDYVFYGDTKNLPYGTKTQREIFDLTIAGIQELRRQGCILIIIACNTASAKALRKIQQQWLPKNAPDTKVLGVIVPTIESLKKKDFPAILMATESTVKSKVYQKELSKIISKLHLIDLPAPKLVPLIEAGKIAAAATEAKKMVSGKAGKAKTLVLGCTHYPLLNKQLRDEFPKLKIIDQTKIIPAALNKYISKHQEIKIQLSNSGKVKILFSEITPTNTKLAKKWFK